MKNHEAAQQLWNRLKSAHVPGPAAADAAAVMRAVRAIGPLAPPTRGWPELAWPTWPYAVAASLMALLTANLVAGMAQWGDIQALAAFGWTVDFQDLAHLVPMVVL